MSEPLFGEDGGVVLTSPALRRPPLLRKEGKELELPQNHQTRRIPVDIIFTADRPDFTVGKKAGQRQGPFRGLDHPNIMVRFSIKIFTPAAAAHQ